MGGESVPVVFCVDIEPDLHTFDPEDPCPWRGIELLIERVPTLRDALEHATGQPPHFSWTVRSDPQVALAYGSPSYALDRYGSFFERVLEAGDGVGIHPHAWRWDGAEVGWVSDHADQSWIDECLEMAVASYVDHFGVVPPFNRYGARFMNTATMNRVRALGVKIDVTVEPGEPPQGPGPFMGGVMLGGVPDCRHAPRIPYHPDPQDCCRAALAGDDALWAIPLTAGRYIEPPDPRPPWTPRVRGWARHPLGTGRRAARRARSSLTRPRLPDLGGPEERTMVMWGDFRSGRDFWDAALHAARQLCDPYLAFAIRSETLLHPGLKQKFESVMDAVVAGPLGPKLTFVRPDEILAPTRPVVR